MPDKGQEHADAEHRERLLAADDQRIEHPPLQPRPVLRHEADDQDHDHNEVDEAVGRQERLVVGIEGRIEPVREQRAEIREFAGHGHDQRQEHIGDAEIQRVAANDDRIDLRAPPSAHQAPNTNRTCQASGLKYQVPAG